MSLLNLSLFAWLFLNRCIVPARINRNPFSLGFAATPSGSTGHSLQVVSNIHFLAAPWWKELGTKHDAHFCHLLTI